MAQFNNSMVKTSWRASSSRQRRLIGAVTTCYLKYLSTVAEEGYTVQVHLAKRY